MGDPEVLWVALQKFRHHFQLMFAGHATLHIVNILDEVAQDSANIFSTAIPVTVLQPVFEFPLIVDRDGLSRFLELLPFPLILPGFGSILCCEKHQKKIVGKVFPELIRIISYPTPLFSRPRLVFNSNSESSQIDVYIDAPAWVLRIWRGLFALDSAIPRDLVMWQLQN